MSPADDGSHDWTGTPPGPEAVAAQIVLDGHWAGAEERARRNFRLAVLAEREGVVVPDDALRVVVDLHIQRHGLRSRDDVEAWEAGTGVGLPQLKAWCLARLQQEALLASCPGAVCREWFESHRADYSAVLLSALSIATEEDAWLLRRAAEESSDFDQLTWSRPQADPGLPAGGALGWVFRRDLPREVVESVFDANDELAGPLLQDGYFRVYRIWRRIDASLTPVVEAECRADWLAARLRAVDPA